MLPDRPTIEFQVWPYMVLIEGPARMVGRLLRDLYQDATIDRGTWSIDHKFESRDAYAQHLQNAGMDKHRQGIGVREPHVVNWLKLRCRSYGLQLHLFSKND